MLAVVPFMVIFRTFHIVAGVLWVGSTFLFTVFIGPAAADVGPSAGPLLANIVMKRRVAKVIMSLSVVTVLSGLVIYIRDVNQFASFGDWISSSFGLVLTIGAVAAIVASLLGIFGVGLKVEELVRIGGEMAGAGGPPSPEVLGRFEATQIAVSRNGRIDLGLQLLAVFAMATARYW